MLTLNGSMLSAMYNTVSAPSVAQDRVIGAYMNSLYYENVSFGSTPLWLRRLAVADGGKTIEARGDFGFAQSWTKNPPNFPQSHTEVTSPGGTLSTWTDVQNTGFTDVLMVADNFSGPPVFSGSETNPRLGGSVPEAGADDYVTEFEDCIDPFEANTSDVNYWVYEGWARGDDHLNGDGSASASEFTNWRAQTTTSYGYSGWFDDLTAALKVDVPGAASRINLIPVARTLVSVMEMAQLSSMGAGDWFFDDAPHGRDSTYLVAGAVCYTTMFQEQAPTPSFTGATIDSAVSSNWTAIAAHIASELGI